MSDFNWSADSEAQILGYQSPIEIITKELRTQMDGNIMSTIQEYGINVDKDELIKALDYDRGQFAKGYAAAARDHSKKGEWEFVAEDSCSCVFKCSNCGRLMFMPKQGCRAEDYAPHCFCGAGMCSEDKE